MSKVFLTTIWAVAVLGIAVAQEGTIDDTEQDLQQVRERIEALQREVGEAVENRAAAERSLRETEIAESRVRKKLGQLRARASAARARQDDLSSQMTRVSADLSAQKDLLARQMRLAWVTGREEWVRLVLSQQDPVEVGRRLVYYGYITRDRSDVIQAVLEKMRQLEQIIAALDREREQLKELEQAQQARLSQLESARAIRDQALALINAAIESRADEIERLQAQAKEKESLLARLSQQATMFPSFEGLPFEKMKGRFTWPTRGKLFRNYGEPRADGQMRWNGVMMTADAGAEVHALYHGRVVYSDWLPGMGLLIVIEHGDGYISLYGHNQDLTREVGEWVGPEDVIAHVGDSGGQGVTGLYFEIRKDGKPINPNRWVK